MKSRKQTKKERKYLPKVDKIFKKLGLDEKSCGCKCPKIKGQMNICNICWKIGKAKYASFQYLIEDNLKVVFSEYLAGLTKRARDSFRRYIFLEDMRQAGVSDLHIMAILNELYLLEDKIKKGN